jgi:ppGpp synthetase/RelA/SpoT-type nucleotidyltranferase
MNIDEYENQYERSYEEFATAVELMLKKAIKDAADRGVPRLQSSNSRAKTARSLRPKLEQRGLLASARIEAEIKDLAGVRLIFYTDTDIDRFLSSRLVPELFEVDWKETKVHHPNPENDDRPYQAIHYIASLKPETLAQPEYARFAGFRCEIQLQTMLSHIWAETSHDIMYKPPTTAGFGTEALKAIEKRLRKINREYLVPAGHEFAKVQNDYERLMQGKALFDRDMLATLAACADNNERREVLSTIKDYVLSNYDDLPGIYPELCRALVAAVDAARQTAPKPIPTELGDLPGSDAGDVTKIAVEILTKLRYVSVEDTFRSLAALYSGETDGHERKRIVDAIEQLARHNTAVWQQAGPIVQFILADLLGDMGAADIDAIKPLAVKIWEEAVGTELRGLTATAETMTFSMGVVVPGDALKQLREKAITGLLNLFDRETTDAGKAQAFSALKHATSMATQGRAGNDLYAIVIANTERIVMAFDERLGQLRPELIRRIEKWMQSRHHRYRQIADEAEDWFGCRAAAQALLGTIERLRDRLNSDQVYVRYKTLFGFQSVFAPHWQDDAFDYTEAEAYRQARIDELVAEVAPETEDSWYAQIALVAAAQSDDGADFSPFCDFLHRLGKVKPEIVLRYIARNDETVLHFLPAMLNGLASSTATIGYSELVDGFIAAGKNLTAIAQHFHRLSPPDIAKAKLLLAQAIAANEERAIVECLALAVQWHAATPAWIADIVMPAMRHLAARGDYHWANRVWYLDPFKDLAKQLSGAEAEQVLDSLIAAPKIDTHLDIVLARLAEAHATAVLAFFGKRLARPKADGEDYDAVPFELHYLHKPLGKDVGAAVDTARGWYARDDDSFQYSGGRLLHAALPEFTEDVSAKFCALARDGTDKDIDFMLEVLPNYRGKAAIHAALMAIADRLPEGDARLERVELCIETTGVVSGAFGFVDAHRAAKAALEPWLQDPRPRVKAFVRECQRRLDVRIASEQRDAEQRQQQRRLDFDDAPDAA